VEKYKTELDQAKATERSLRKQLKDNVVINQVAATVEKEKEHFREFTSSSSTKPLEEELRNLKIAYDKLEGIMDEITADNLKLKEQLEIREQEKEIILNERDTLLQVSSEILERLNDQGE
jgi:hypothetical protein